MPTGARAICIFAVEPSRAIRLSYRPGRVFPLYAGASGKILLPWVSPQLVESAIAQADGHLMPDGRRLTPARVRREMASMRAAGYCVSHGEVDAGAGAVAAPVFGKSGQIFAAVSVAGPETGFADDRLPDLIERVLAAAAEIGRHVVARP
jgi:DNA-binding IclR family transcriptional regulator